MSISGGEPADLRLPVTQAEWEDYAERAAGKERSGDGSHSPSPTDTRQSNTHDIIGCPWAKVSRNSFALRIIFLQLLPDFDSLNDSG